MTSALEDVWEIPHMRSTLIAVFVVWMCASVGTTSLIETDLTEISREARAIALGRVVAVDGRWTGDRRRIETLVTLEAESYLKGALGAEVQFLVPGGQLGRYRHLVVGAPQFTVGQRIVVFLGARGPSIPYILGLSQGLFRVTAHNGESMVAPPTLLALPATTRGDPARRPMRLDEFTRQVRALAGGVQ
jgi:hypothetical protein